MLDSLAVEKQDDSRIIHKIKNLIEKDYAKDISLNYVAENVNLTPAYVSYIFKKETGQTLVKYITDVKMMKAKVMLEEGTLKLFKLLKRVVMKINLILINCLKIIMELHLSN